MPPKRIQLLSPDEVTRIANKYPRDWPHNDLVVLLLSITKEQTILMGSPKFFAATTSGASLGTDFLNLEKKLKALGEPPELQLPESNEQQRGFLIFWRSQFRDLIALIHATDARIAAIKKLGRNASSVDKIIAGIAGSLAKDLTFAQKFADSIARLPASIDAQLAQFPEVEEQFDGAGATSLVDTDGSQPWDMKQAWRAMQPAWLGLVITRVSKAFAIQDRPKKCRSDSTDTTMTDASYVVVDGGPGGELAKPFLYVGGSGPTSRIKITNGYIAPEENLAEAFSYQANCCGCMSSDMRELQTLCAEGKLSQQELCRIRDGRNIKKKNETNRIIQELEQEFLSVTYPM